MFENDYHTCINGINAAQKAETPMDGTARWCVCPSECNMSYDCPGCRRCPASHKHKWVVAKIISVSAI